MTSSNCKKSVWWSNTASPAPLSTPPPAHKSSENLSRPNGQSGCHPGKRVILHYFFPIEYFFQQTSGCWNQRRSSCCYHFIDIFRLDICEHQTFIYTIFYSPQQIPDQDYKIIPA